MQIVNIVFDFVLCFTALWMIQVVRKSGLGGVMGNTLGYITIGAVVLGVAHMLETITFEVIKLQDIPLGEFLHRCIVLAGFVFLIIGMQGLSKLRRPN